MPRILLVDDNVVLLDRLAAQLREAGYAVDLVSNASHADSLTQEERYDMIVLDVGIQHGSGWMLLKKLARTVPVIVASGEALEEDVIRGLEMGAIDYIAKPFRTAEILARLRARLRPGDAPAARAPAISVDLGMNDDSGSFKGIDLLEFAPSAPPRMAADPPAPRPEEDELIFIPYAEERSLLSGLRESEADELRPDELERLSLGQQLRAARQRRRVTLVQAELDTRIRMMYIQALEEEMYARLPRGAPTEAMLRTLAAYVGIPADPLVEQYRQAHVSLPLEPPPSLGGPPAPRQFPTQLAMGLAVAAALFLGIGAIWLLDREGILTVLQRAREVLVGLPFGTWIEAIWPAGS
jgi:CheY-like chemotaxis protein/transcriptional regulator with XRE-family HTH domain